MLWNSTLTFGLLSGAVGGAVRVLSTGTDILLMIRVRGWADAILNWVSELAVGAAAGVLAITLVQWRYESTFGVAFLAGIFGRQVLLGLYNRQFGGGD